MFAICSGDVYCDIGHVARSEVRSVSVRLTRWRSGSGARPRRHARTSHRGPGTRTRGCRCREVVDARFELCDFVDKLDIVVDDGLLVLSNLFSFAFEVPDGLSLLPNDVGQGDKQVFVGRGAPPGSRVGLAAFNRDGVGVVG